MDLSGRPFVIGVVHLRALPGAPDWKGSIPEVCEAALGDARCYEESGFDGVFLENFGDAPFTSGEVPWETVAAMAAVARVVRKEVGIPIGFNVLRNDARSGMGLAAAGLASFVRINVHTGAMLTDQGLLQGRAAETLRERARLAPDVRILADVHVKHLI